ncbi:uncharacterized protein FOMMEDRAFT_168520 [Fomitiporia mediterranea MF3/22]|uniref:uncharacterized protein n=1 Tax=Fomitiporia mediterranea (strain MF3/22) TaxID=694068 RepID=UPI0004408D5F|nr:uncharacterized protein FOMMEDRAFT_168520 [Fomitiporia mediterranea MF3/22]EJD01936.1 hypothetical protein FOMMEDRAFT_168520 [Fomitiporia mediterranea MF3/22]
MFRKKKASSYSRPPAKSNASSSTSRMPKRKRARSLPRKTKQVPNPQFIGGEPSAPTSKEWESMTQYHSFIVKDAEGNEHRFPIQTYSLILPEGADPENPPLLRDYWVGRIKEIRGRNNDPFDVWASVQWMMSIQDVNEYIKVPSESFGKLERVLSNHFDFVHTSCFASLTHVAPYVESDTEPPAISDETFYYRYTFDIYSYELKPVLTASCFCNEGYNPNESPIMHFCPRKGCCKAFHADCLRAASYVEKPRKDLRSLKPWRELQFEGAIYDSSEEEGARVKPPVSNASSSRTLVSSSNQPNYKRIRSRSPNAVPLEVDKHQNLPLSLLTIARSPMVRGIGTDLPYEWSCVTGNLAVVTRARKLVREVIEDGRRLPRKWRSLLEIPGQEDKDDDEDSMIDMDGESVKNIRSNEQIEGRKMTGKRKRIARLTLPVKRHKIKHTVQSDGEIDIRPDAKEYARWRTYRSFVVTDENGEPVTFSVGEYGLVIPYGVSPKYPLPLHEHWVGKIRQIRSKGYDPSEVWADVQWLWSAVDIAEANGTLDLTQFGSMERFPSNSSDFVHSSCFQYLAKVVQFNEGDPEPPNITDETFYTRYSYDHIKNRILPKIIASCFCGVPYNPDEAPAIHFCPRKKCNVAFHAPCLRNNGWVYRQELKSDTSLDVPPETPGKRKREPTQTSESESPGLEEKTTTTNTIVPRALQFERTLPGATLGDSLNAVPANWVIDVNSNVDSSPGLAFNASVSQTPPSGKKRSRIIFTRYNLVPSTLLALARSPMARGNDTGLPEDRGCVTGNVAFVSRARKLVARIVHQGKPLPEDWFDQLDLPKYECDDESDGSGGRKSKEDEVLEWVVKDEGLLCPRCGGAI